MGNKSLATLTVRYDIPDDHLIEILKKMLPNLLVIKMGISRTQAEQAAEGLAYQIVTTARQCNQVHLVPDVANRILLNAPSKQECDDFKKAVDEIIKIRYVEKLPKRKSNVIKTNVGKLWYHLRERVMGLPPEKDDLNGKGGAGPRG